MRYLLFLHLFPLPLGQVDISFYLMGFLTLPKFSWWFTHKLYLFAYFRSRVGSPVLYLLSLHNISSHFFLSPVFRLQAGRHDGGWVPELWARVVVMAGGGGGSFIPSLLFLYWFKSWFFLYWLSQSIVSPFPYMIIFSVQLICTIKYWFHKRKIDVAFLNVKYWYCILKL